MTMLESKTMTTDEYLEFEKTSEVRHEFVDGKLYAMAGETLLHDDIVLNVVEALRATARAKSCQLHATNIQTLVKGNRYRYPDVVLTCETIRNPRLIQAPCFILEVLSDSTADVDHGIKLEEYTKILSLQRYAIVSQNSRQVIVYKREGERWTFEVLLENGEIEIPCLETILTLEQIYANLEL
jgi:Uma2 family endonuclease